MMDSGKTSTREMRMREDGILLIRYFAGARETAKEAGEGIMRNLSLTGGKKAPVLMDMRPLHSMDFNARTLYAENARLRESATALLFDSAFTRTLAEFYLGALKDALPARLFDKEEDAIQWLKTFL